MVIHIYSKRLPYQSYYQTHGLSSVVPISARSPQRFFLFLSVTSHGRLLCALSSDCATVTNTASIILDELKLSPSPLRSSCPVRSSRKNSTSHFLLKDAAQSTAVPRNAGWNTTLCVQPQLRILEYSFGWAHLPESWSHSFFLIAERLLPSCQNSSVFSPLTIEKGWRRSCLLMLRNNLFSRIC